MPKTRSLGAPRPESTDSHPRHRPSVGLIATLIAIIVALGAATQFGGLASTLVASPSMTVYQDTGSVFHWSSGWRTVRTSTASGGTEHATGRIGATVTLIYNGTKVEVIGPTRPAGGTIEVTLDGRTRSVSTHSSAFHGRQVLYSATPAAGRHVLTIRFASSGTHRYFALDEVLATVVAPALAVVPTPAPTPVPTVWPAATPTPRPTSTPRPTATPTVAPTPPPAPPPTSAPGPGIAVPSSIDATGSTDVSSALITFIDSVPSGSTINFRAGATYRVDKAIKFGGRTNLTLNGNGSTIRGHGGVTEPSSIFWLLTGNNGVTIENFGMVGNDPSPGVYHPGSEGAHGVLVDGASNTTIANDTISAVWGDCVEVNGGASGVTYRDSNCASAGRQGVTIINGRNVVVERDAFPRSGYCTFDIEPNNTSESASNISFLDNTAGTWSNSFLSADGAIGSHVSGITVSGNTITGGTLLTVFSVARRQDVVFTNNASTVKGYGPILRFAHVDGLTVTGNVQPLSGGTLLSITDSTSVTHQ